MVRGGFCREIAAGQTTASVCYDADYYPYGGEKVVTNTCPQNYKWTGKERDAETGNDDFDARYYSSVYGRFLSADWSAVPAPVPYANPTNPQTLNLYAIVRDNPESYADLDGHVAALGSTGACGDATSGCGGSDQNAATDILKEAGQVLKDTVVGAGKEVANEITQLANIVNAPIDIGLAKLGVNFSFGQGAEFQASTPGEKGAMLGTSLGLLLVGGGETKIGDAVKLGKSLASEAQVAEKGTAILGAGTGKALKQAGRLSAEYGGKAGEWTKMTSSAYRAGDGSVISTHWYENIVSGIRTEYKSIVDSALWK